MVTAENSHNQVDEFWKCDYCICECRPKWEPCKCDCSTHKMEDCPHPDPTKVEALEKRKILEEEETYKKKIFITNQHNYRKRSTLVSIIPKRKHNDKKKYIEIKKRN